MAETSNLYDAFEANSKKEWLAKVEKDLKGRPLEDLHWQIGKEIEVAPFYHPEDILPTGILETHKATNDWQIGEYIVVDAPKSANQAALEGLAGGVNAPVFLLKEEPSKEELAILLKDINLTYITTHFNAEWDVENWEKFLGKLAALAKERAYEPASLKGSISIDSSNYSKTLELQAWTKVHFPRWKLFQLVVPFNGIDQIVEDLAATLKNAQQMLAHAEKDRRSLIEQLYCTVEIGTSYFVEIAKLRAWKLLWANLANAYGIPTTPPELEVQLAKNSHNDQVNTNMIRTSTQAMAAALGGADRLVLRAANLGAGEASTSFSRRIARNVQHLLKMESYLDRVQDPAAGSYYIETLSNQFAEKAWKVFQNH